MPEEGGGGGGGKEGRKNPGGELESGMCFKDSLKPAQPLPLQTRGFGACTGDTRRTHACLQATFLEGTKTPGAPTASLREDERTDREEGVGQVGWAWGFWAGLGRKKGRLSGHACLLRHAVSCRPCS